jgi:hypothetical protein
VRAAILALRTHIYWKPGKDVQNLQTRIRYGHLPSTTTLVAYEALIKRILHDELADIYVYKWQQAHYPTVVGMQNRRRWLVMCGINGVIETAFPPTDPEEYLADPRFHYLGKSWEIIT